MNERGRGVWPLASRDGWCSNHTFDHQGARPSIRVQCDLAISTTRIAAGPSNIVATRKGPAAPVTDPDSNVHAIGGNQRTSRGSGSALSASHQRGRRGGAARFQGQVAVVITACGSREKRADGRAGALTRPARTRIRDEIRKAAGRLCDPFERRQCRIASGAAGCKSNQAQDSPSTGLHGRHQA